MAKFRKNKKPKDHPEGKTDEVNKDVEINGKSKKNKQQSKPKSSDVDDGKTIFVRNLSFHTTQEALRLFMTNIAPVEYCLLCKDKEVDQSKGTAFVKFKKVEDADRLVGMDKEQLILDDRRLNIDHALPRIVVQKNKDQKERDKRNLYLAREGLIYAGSPAAEGVSKVDLEKRLALEGKKRMLLQKLTNFVSRTRLCVHNVPPDYDNHMLKELFVRSLDGTTGVKIVECRIMKNRNASGKLGGSKGFAFVEFEKHEHALKALRKLNNNPDVFTDVKRPIVELAIEDKLALNKRLRQRIRNEEAKKKGKKGKEDKPSTAVVQSEVKLDDANPVKDYQGKKKAPVLPKKVKNINKEKNDIEVEKMEESEEGTGYTGFIAAPLRANEPVIAPKLNRKLGEAKKLIAEKQRQKKFEEKKVKTKKEHLSKRQLKLARRKEAAALASKVKIPKELDDFEETFVRKSGSKILTDDRMNNGLEVPAKKVKWFRDT